MTVHTSTLEARQRRARKQVEERRSYNDMLRRLFPQDFRGSKAFTWRAPAERAEVEARITLYREDALAQRPIRYIVNSRRIVDVVGPGNQK